MSHEERDFSDLMDNEILFKVDETGHIYKATALIDYSLGISIVLSEPQRFFYADNMGYEDCEAGEELFCTNGPLSKHGMAYDYKATFFMAVAQIRKGVFSTKKTKEFLSARRGKEFVNGVIHCAYK